MKIVVCIKPVPDSEYYHKIKIDPIKKTLIRDEIPTKINEEDKRALEAALIAKDSLLCVVEVDIFSMAPESARENLLQALAMGADKVFHLIDKRFAGSDTLATAYILSEGVKKTGLPDLIITGNTTEDGGTCQVSAQLGEWLDWPHVQNVDALMIEENIVMVWKKVEKGHIKYRINLPAVIGVTRKINKPRIPNIMDLIKTSKKPYIIINADDLDLNYRFVGLSGSPTQVGEIFNMNESRKAELIKGKPEEIVDKLIDIIRESVSL